ncbi:hypothetical protein [Aurantiacibacter rhizosphaerae]|uniref:Uncharacterized protein n=1 Tax=Aurantiacibacter rhizosphaerae TaxID=2691582 RepID=A0A844XF32_9SPHN|nr:hypothetical protein [Aurantiacibacter rhizosphaerae]MWV29087.1 hypothetical protein [Aurantiacibacter rhizosphaerae]
MARYTRAEAFFPIMTLVVLGFIILGFGSAMAARGSGYVPTPALILHGVVTLAWFTLTLVQALLIRRANFTLHRALGSVSITLVLGIVVLGYLTTARAVTNLEWSIAGFDNIGSAIFPFFDILTFAIVYAVGVATRRDAAAHKRLMTLAGVMMMDPAVARVAIFVLGAPPLALVLEVAILLAFPIYDWRTRGRPHWASVFGIVLFLACFALRMALGGTDAWAGFVAAVF